MSNRLSTWVPERTDLGVILKKMGAVEDEHIEAALDKQDGDHSSIGELLVQSGVISKSTLETALAYQQRMRSGEAIAVMTEIIMKRAPDSLREFTSSLT